MNRDFDVIPCIPFIPVNNDFKNLNLTEMKGIYRINPFIDRNIPTGCR